MELSIPVPSTRPQQFFLLHDICLIFLDSVLLLLQKKNCCLQIFFLLFLLRFSSPPQKDIFLLQMVLSIFLLCFSSPPQTIFSFGWFAAFFLHIQMGNFLSLTEGGGVTKAILAMPIWKQHISKRGFLISLFILFKLLYTA